MNYLFSVAVMSNMLSMTAMLIFLSIAGQSHMAADLGVVQAATTALFYAFSANARNIVLSASNASPAKSMLNIRVILLIPLVLAATWLSTSLGGVEPIFAGVLILRRAVEWIGEVDLSEKERLGEKHVAALYILIQAFLFIFAAMWLFFDMPHPLLGLFLWALLPLALSGKFAWVALGEFSNALAGLTQKIAPHFGSTVVIGVSLYVFRLLMILIVGKNMSGDLFAAFAIGGILGSLTVNAFGPSIAFNEKKYGALKLSNTLKLIMWIFSGVGFFIVSLSFLTDEIHFLGKNSIFWRAIGFSMIGGVVMTHAQLLRNRLLVHNENHDLFGPDLLMNVLIVAAMPIAYFTMGVGAVTALSLLGALLAWSFYKSSELAEIATKEHHPLLGKYLQLSLAVSVLVPFFVQIGNGMFLAKEMLVTDRYTLLTLPIPVSIFLTYLAILTIGSYRSVHLSLSVLFFTFVLMCFSTLIVAAHTENLEREKIILIIQFVLPMGALVLGEMTKVSLLGEARIERGFLYVLAVLVPWQLVASWLQGGLQLTSYMYLFSIYQHMHYVPIVFVSAYVLVMFSLWPNMKYKRTLLVLSPLMGIYVAAALSPMASMILTLGLVIFSISRWRIESNRLSLLLVIGVLAIFSLYSYVEISAMINFNRLTGMVTETVSSWRQYFAEIGGSARSLFLGHASVYDKYKFPGSHNYYLDMVRNFGLVAIIPVLLMIAYTLKAAFMAKRNVLSNPMLLGNGLVLLFLLVIDNSTQVSLRQPYSGVFTFFIWGLFLARLSQKNQKTASCVK